MDPPIQKACKKIAVATRFHLGNASNPPSNEKIEGWIQNLASMAGSVEGDAVIAVDATPKLSEYDFVQVIREHAGNRVHVLPVTPWGKFVPALNALIRYAHEDLQSDQILFVSAEVTASPASIQTLSEHCSEENGDSYVLVAGGALNGHVYEGYGKTVTLHGRTCPWNTLAIWNLPKLALTGFLPVSDMGPMGGVEECAAVAIHQQLFPKAKAKMVRLSDVTWDEHFEDEERRQWHERKMNSKIERAGAQLKLLNLVDKGVVELC